MNKVLRGFYSAVLLCVSQTALALFAADDVDTLITRVLQTNRPWLDPKPTYGTYNLLRRPDGEVGGLTGPFSLYEAPLDVKRWSGHWPLPHRVGSIIWTPLHVMAHHENPYTAVLVGTTNWFKHTSLLRIDVTFAADVGLDIGMGGQVNDNGQTSYTHGGVLAKTAQILIDPLKAVPLYIETHPTVTNSARSISTWKFDPLFFSVDGGLAPRSLEFESPTVFHERQEFQVAGNIWLFKRGDGWFPSNSSYSVPGSHIQTIELINLRLQMALVTRSSASEFSISLPSGDLSGFGVESADTPEGPWAFVESRNVADKSTLTMTKPPGQSAQFYRLRK